MPCCPYSHPLVTGRGTPSLSLVGRPLLKGSGLRALSVRQLLVQKEEEVPGVQHIQLVPEMGT